MLTRHRDALLSRLEQVVLLGYCRVTYAELRLWYGRERLTKLVWADLLDRWKEVEDEASLLVGAGEGMISLIYGDGLTATDDSWWEDFATWAELL